MLLFWIIFPLSNILITKKGYSINRYKKKDYYFRISPFKSSCYYICVNHLLWLDSIQNIDKIEGEGDLMEPIIALENV
ncbi:MAG: hypothetical protein K0S80_5017, partial [Neobacillus sp.]|nr:hypothetical protein [Neobacillus sp.]